MAARGIVDADGRVTLPKALLREIGGKPGDQVTFRRTGPATVELRLSPEATGDEDGGREELAAPPEFTPLTLAEMLERFKIEGPIDEYDLQEGWKDDAAREIIERMMDE